MMGAPRGPRFGGSMSKLFEDNNSFSADIEVTTTDENKKSAIIPGKIAKLDSMSRMEMDLSTMKGDAVPAEAIPQLKTMGLDKMIILSRPDKKLNYMVYPGLSAHVEMPIEDSDETKTASDYTIEQTEVGKETIGSHPCVKNKTVISEKNAPDKKYEYLVWNAPDLKKFPLKIQREDGGALVVMAFNNVKFDKPDAAQFEAPKNSTKHDSMMSIMQEVMMKKMSEGK